jgi:hypothetical protein
MDGDAMLARIMAGDGAERSSEALKGADGPDGIIGLEAQEEPLILGESGEPEPALGHTLQSLKGELRGLRQTVRELVEQLPRRVSDVVEREVEPTAEKLADLESRLGILQRVVSRLGGRMDAVEQRVARLELGERPAGGRSEELREMAGHVHDLSRLMAAFARRLGHGGPDQAPPTGPDPRVSEVAPGPGESRGGH